MNVDKSKPRGEIGYEYCNHRCSSHGYYVGTGTFMVGRSEIDLVIRGVQAVGL